MTWVPFNRQNRPTSNVHLCTTCVRTVDERKTSVTNPSSQGITLCGQKNPVDLPKQAVQSVLRTGKRTPTGTRGTVSESQGNPQGGPRGTEGPTGFTRWKRGRWRMILDPHRRTFTGEAVGRWRGRTGQPGRTNRWSSQGGRRPGNRTEELCGGITFEVVAPGNRGHGAGPKGVVEPGNRGGDTGRCGGSSRATGEAVERSGGRTGQPGRTKEKGIARRGRELRRAMSLVERKANAPRSVSGGSPSSGVAPGGALASAGSAARGASLFHPGWARNPTAVSQNAPTGAKR